MIVLACETSTLLGSVALAENGQILASEESFRQGSHSDTLHPFVQKVLDQAGKRISDIDLFASGIGPGSFTGIRISLNAVKAWAYSTKKNVFGLNSLHSLALAAHPANLSNEFKDLPIISMINAYKNMCYVATYRQENGALVEVKKPDVIRVQNMGDYITEKSIVCGDGYTTYSPYFSTTIQPLITRLPEISDDPHARTLAVLASQKASQSTHWSELLPLYLRASEAEENLKGIKYQPLK